MATADALDAALWLRARPARKRSGLSPTTLSSLAAAGRIRTLALPGVSIRFHAGDCDTIRRELVGEPAEAPATASA